MIQNNEDDDLPEIIPQTLVPTKKINYLNNKDIINKCFHLNLNTQKAFAKILRIEIHFLMTSHFQFIKLKHNHRKQ